MDTKLIVRYLTREFIGLLTMAVALFWAAGRMNWGAAWAALLVMLGWIVATAYIILRYNPELLAERLGPRKGAKGWDTAIMSCLGITQLLRYIVAGLDQRGEWTGGFPFAVQFIALIVCILGYAVVVWATASNAFFSQIVRLQPERGQTVVSSGPYRYVRHPAYLGAILYELASPVLLASWWSLIFGVLGTVLLFIRTALEDRTLQTGLAGYTEYANRVRHRLLPGIW